MSMRREGREAAIQFLYQLDMNATPQAEITDPFWVLHASENAAGIARQARAFADELIAGVNAHRADIDERITGCLVNFQFSRLATVDRNILRVAVYELIHTQTCEREEADDRDRENEDAGENGALDTQRGKPLH